MGQQNFRVSESYIVDFDLSKNGEEATLIVSKYNDERRKEFGEYKRELVNIITGHDAIYLNAVLTNFAKLTHPIIEEVVSSIEERTDKFERII